MQPAPLSSKVSKPADSPEAKAQAAGVETPPREAGAAVETAYEFVREIARGGMGVVFEARHKHLGRTVALKIVRDATFAHAEDFGRFRAETEVVAHLDHPNIVPIYDVGEMGGQPFFTMKLVEGGSLADRVKAGPMPAREAARLMATVARAVQHAHERGVLHRDLKPGNILLDAQGKPFLTDFGLAKFAGTDSGLTLTGALIGTPEYMAPEQARGETHALTTACDVWALGVLLYQLVAGRLPFAGNHALQIMDRIAKEEAVPLVGVGDLSTIVARCLEKDPARRMRSAGFLAEELERWLAGEAIRSRHVTPVERAWKWGRRHPYRVAAMLALLVTISAGSVVSYLLWQREQTANFSLHAANDSLTRMNDELTKSLRLSTAHRLASESRVLVQEDATLGLLLAAESAETTRRADGTVLPQSAGALFHALQSVGGIDASASDKRQQDAPGMAGRNALTAVSLRPSPDERWLMSLNVGVDGVQAALFESALPLKASPRRRWIAAGPARAGSSFMDVCWRADSRELLSVGFDGEVRAWRIESDAAEANGNDAPPSRVLGRLGEEGTELKCARWMRSAEGEAAGLLTIEVREKMDHLRWYPLDFAATNPLGAGLEVASSELNSVAMVLRISPDGRWAFRADAFGDGTPALVKLNGPQDPPTTVLLPEGRTGVDSFAFSVDARHLAFARRDGTLREYDLDAGGLQEVAASGRALGRRKAAINALAFSPDGKYLAAAGSESLAEMIPLSAEAPAVVFRLPSRTAWSAAFSGDGRWLAIGDEDRVVSVWSMAALPRIGEPLEFRGLSGTVVKTGFSRDGHILYGLGGDFSCRRWEFNGNSSGAIPTTSAAGEEPISGLSASPDGRWIVAVPVHGTTAAAGEDTIRFFDTAHGLAEYHLSGQRLPTATAFSPDGRWFASTGRDARVRVWNGSALAAALPEGGAVPEPIILHAEGTRERYDCFVAFHPAGRLYCATGDGDLFEWNLKEPNIAATMRRHEVHSIHYLLPGIAVSPDGHWLAVGRHGWDTAPRKDSTQAGNLVLVFDVSDPDTIAPKYELRAHHRELGTVAFSQDSRWLAAGAQDGPADVWDLHAMDVARSARVSPVGAHLLLGVSFSPTAKDRRRTKWLALGGSDGRLHLWDWQRGAAAIRTVETSEPIHSAVFLPDGRVATGSADGRVRVWETDPEKLIELARQTAGRELLPAERDRFMRQR